MFMLLVAMNSCYSTGILVSPVYCCRNGHGFLAIISSRHFGKGGKMVHLINEWGRCVVVQGAVVARGFRGEGGMLPWETF